MAEHHTDCSIMVLSCDRNKNVVDIFFRFFKKNWGDCPFDVYLGMENETKSVEGVRTLLCSGAWGRRFLSYLKEIDSEYVLVILEDFVLEERADTKQILQYLKLMKKNKKIVNIAFAEIYDEHNADTGIPHLKKRKKNADYLINLQTGLWRKSFLEKIVRENENPWQTELYGSVRARKYKDSVFLCLDSDENSPYKYGRGWLIVRGKWNGNEILRLGAEKFGNDVLDGKDIIYNSLMKINFMDRVKRRMGIEVRKALSRIGVYC